MYMGVYNKINRMYGTAIAQEKLEKRKAAIWQPFTYPYGKIILI